MVVTRLVFGLPRFSFLVLMASNVAFFVETWLSIRKMWLSIRQRSFYFTCCWFNECIYFFCRHVFGPENSSCVSHHSSVEAAYCSFHFFVHRASAAADKHNGLDICLINSHLFGLAMLDVHVLFFFRMATIARFSLLFHSCFHIHSFRSVSCKFYIE